MRGGYPFLDQVLDHLLSLFEPALPMYLVCSLKTDQPTVLSSSLMEHCHQPGHVSYHLNILWFSLPVWWYYPINQLHSVSSTISLQILINILTFSGSVFKPSSLQGFHLYSLNCLNFILTTSLKAGLLNSFDFHCHLVDFASPLKVPQ